MKKIKNSLLIFFFLFIVQCKENDENSFAGGFKGGTYDTMANSLQDIPQLKVKVVPSNGSLDNINLLLDKKVDFALTQIDMYYSAKLGNASIPKEISILLPVLQDEIHLVVDASIKSVSELKGKKVAIGHSVSGIKATSISVLRLSGIEFNEIDTLELSPEEAIPKLINKEIDAVFVVSGIPVKLLSSLPAEVSNKIKILSFDDSILNLIKPNNKVYQKSIIPANTYSWQKNIVNTLQVQTVLIGRKDLSKEKVTTFLDNLFSNLDNLNVAHPEWNGIKKEILLEKMNQLPEFFHPRKIPTSQR